MLPTAVVDSSHRLVVAAIRCAWAQWASIGASTSRGPQMDDEIVDPEALILGSLALAQSEPRLKTLTTDWAVTNSELLSVARMRALAEGPFAGATSGLQEFAHTLVADGGDARWRTLAIPTTKPNGTDTQPRIRKSAAPRWNGGRTLMLQLRRGFGVGVKPDLLSVLIGRHSEWTDVSTLAELSSYSIAGVRRAADEMASAGFIETSGGHSRAFRVDANRWGELLGGISSPRWRRRAEGYAFVVQWQQHLEQRTASHDSEFSLAIQFGVRMTDFWKLWLEVGVTRQPTSSDPQSAWASRKEASDALVRWFEDRAQYGDEHDQQTEVS